MKHREIDGKHYEIIRLLGKGKSGYSYLVKHESLYYVLKQIHHEPCSYYTFGDKLQAEWDAYHTLLKLEIPIPYMVYYDRKQEVILKEYIEGPSIYDLVLEKKVEEKYIDQMKQLCQKLYQKGFNIDYFPTNFIIKNDQIYYIDYEVNKYMEEWSFENWGQKYWYYGEEILNYAKAQEKEKGEKSCTQ